MISNSISLYVLISLSTIFSRSTQVAANGSIPFLFMTKNSQNHQSKTESTMSDLDSIKVDDSQFSILLRLGCSSKALM